MIIFGKIVVKYNIKRHILQCHILHIFNNLFIKNSNYNTLPMYLTAIHLNICKFFVNEKQEFCHKKNKYKSVDHIF